ncbi:MAG: shikimate kinase [Cyclobacteriaceae bacterium]|nr:shikimate kinase [Cyclobacteriaceae bacterium]MCH8517639.1 shikimate kinase [Cyclobacteriaceae bacterium]
MKIYLIGLPGSGKSTLGKLLANELRLTFYDLDDLIQNNHKMSIGEIFKEKGEDGFREIEREELQKLSLDEDSFLCATGGGAPCFHNNMELMIKTGLTIYLDVPIPVIVDRLKGDTSRPLLEGNALASRLQELKEERERIYMKARIHHQINEKEPDNTAELIHQVKRITID